jgi:hypothetical protein
MHKHLTGFSGHWDHQHRSNEELDKSLHSAAINALTIITIIMAAIAIATLLNILHFY